MKATPPVHSLRRIQTTTMSSKVVLCALLAVVTTGPRGAKSYPGGYLDQGPVGTTGASLGGSLGTVVGAATGVNGILEGSVISTAGGQLLSTGLTGVSPVSLVGSSAGVLGAFRPVIPILLDHREGPYPDGTYNFRYATANGISRQEQGYPVNGMVAQQGGWSFTFPDGTPTFVNFVADANGFRAESDRLPVAPLHAVAQIEKAKQEDAALASSGYEYDSQGGISPLGTTALLSQYGSGVSGSGTLYSQRYGTPLLGSGFGSVLPAAGIASQVSALGSGSVINTLSPLRPVPQSPSLTYGK